MIPPIPGQPTAKNKRIKTPTRRRKTRRGGKNIFLPFSTFYSPDLTDLTEKQWVHLRIHRSGVGMSGCPAEQVNVSENGGGMSRAEVRWGPRFSSTAPPSTPIPPSSDFPVGWPLCGGECRAEVRCVRRNFSNRAQHASADGEEAADGARCDGGPRGGPGRNRYTVNAR